MGAPAAVIYLKRRPGTITPFMRPLPMMCLWLASRALSARAWSRSCAASLRRLRSTNRLLTSRSKISSSLASKMTDYPRVLSCKKKRSNCWRSKDSRRRLLYPLQIHQWIRAITVRQVSTVRRTQNKKVSERHSSSPCSSVYSSSMQQRTIARRLQRVRSWLRSANWIRLTPRTSKSASTKNSLTS